MTLSVKWRVLVAAIVGLAAQAPVGAAGTVLNPPPQAKDWAALAKLPDWSGVWTPNITDQDARIETDPVPWNKAVAAQVAPLDAAEKAGNPKGLFVNCLPEVHAHLDADHPQRASSSCSRRAA